MASPSSELLREISQRYQERGYEVYIEPSPSMLPEFMQKYRPDAVAFKSNERIAIELVSSADVARNKIKKLNDIFQKHPEWRLQVYFSSDFRREKELNVVSKKEITKTIQSADYLIKNGHTKAALLMTWAALEALARNILPDTFRRPQSPGRIIQVLASYGYIDTDQETLLRSMADARNQTIHGALDFDVQPKQLSMFVNIVKGLLGSP